MGCCESKEKGVKEKPQEDAPARPSAPVKQSDANAEPPRAASPALPPPHTEPLPTPSPLETTPLFVRIDSAHSLTHRAQEVAAQLGYGQDGGTDAESATPGEEGVESTERGAAAAGAHLVRTPAKVRLAPAELQRLPSTLPVEDTRQCGGGPHDDDDCVWPSAVSTTLQPPSETEWRQYPVLSHRESRAATAQPDRSHSGSSAPPRAWPPAAPGPYGSSLPARGTASRPTTSSSSLPERMPRRGQVDGDHEPYQRRGIRGSDVPEPMTFYYQLPSTWRVSEDGNRVEALRASGRRPPSPSREPLTQSEELFWGAQVSAAAPKRVSGSGSQRRQQSRRRYEMGRGDDDEVTIVVTEHYPVYHNGGSYPATRPITYLFNTLDGVYGGGAVPLRHSQ